MECFVAYNAKDRTHSGRRNNDLNKELNSCTKMGFQKIEIEMGDNLYNHVDPTSK